MANDVTDAMVEAAAKSLCEYHCVAISGPCIEERKCSGWQVWTAPAKEALHDALAARPLPEGMETTEEEWDRFCDSAHEDSFIAHAKRDFDRLRARLAEAEAEKKEVRKLLVRCHDRIHVLPRTSDTELASRIEAMLGRLK